MQRICLYLGPRSGTNVILLRPDFQQILELIYGESVNMESWSWYNFLLVWLAGFELMAGAYNMGEHLQSR